MYKLITLLCAATVCCMGSFAQKKQKDSVRKYLDNRLAFTNKKNMQFPALALKEADHWMLVSVYQDTGILLKAYFLDENLSIKDGPFTLYHRKKIKAVEGRYVNNIKQGVWKYWDSAGQLKDSGAYKNNQHTGEWRSWNTAGQLIEVATYLDSADITTIARGTSNPRERSPSILAGDTIVATRHGRTMTYYDNGQLQDSGAYKLNHKDGLWKTWYKNGNPESMGAYVRNAQEGEWEYYRENGTRSSKEKYVKNKVASLECYDEQGNFSGNTCPILKPPVALGKFMDFDKYVLDNIYWPQELEFANIQGKVIIQYTITKEGELEDMRVIDTPHRLMALAVARFFETLKWSPAVSHNRPIAYTMKYEVPFFR